MAFRRLQRGPSPDERNDPSPYPRTPHCDGARWTLRPILSHAGHLIKVPHHPTYSDACPSHQGSLDGSWEIA